MYASSYDKTTLYYGCINQFTYYVNILTYIYFEYILPVYILRSITNLIKNLN